jgi:endonuclease III
MTPESIETRLRAEKVGSPGQSAQYWPRCAGTLFEMFDGEPLTLYKGGSIDALVRFKRGEVGDRLPGFGPKILSLLAMFYEELKLMQMPEDAFPVDVHVQRLMIATGVLGGTGRLVNEDAEKILRPLICTIALEEGWSALELAHAIWFLGNRLCTGCYRTAIPKTLCPTYDQCGGCPSTHLYFHKGLWDLDARRHRKGGDRTFALPEDASLFV